MRAGDGAPTMGQAAGDVLGWMRDENLQLGRNDYAGFLQPRRTGERVTQLH